MSSFTSTRMQMALAVVAAMWASSLTVHGQDGDLGGGVSAFLSDQNSDDFSFTRLTEGEPTASPAVVADPAVDVPCPCSTCKGGGPHVSCCWGSPVEWSKVPAWLCQLHRPGFFPNPPTTPGYFSAADWLHGDCQEKRPPSGYPPFAIMPYGFFDADFRYVESKPFEDRTIVEKLKRIYLTDCLLFSTGGQAWMRFHNENNSRLTEVQNNYALPRVRAYGDLWFGDSARVYGEYIWADIMNEELPPIAGDVNRGDILNLFLDVNVIDWDGAPVVARVGRQELTLGSQRLISSLDWVNARRKFEGVRTFRRGEKWDLDAFWLQLVPALPNEFDRPDEKQDFMGTWATYRPEKGEFLDFYYLFLNNTNRFVREGIVEAPVEVSTVGSRWTGDENSYLWDFEGALQFGNRDTNNMFAGMATAGVGKHMKELPGTPTGWIYYDYASGDSDPNDGTSHTFNQLYPFGHYYMGWADLVGRQNIHDANAQLYFYPTHWTTVWLQYHHFWLAEARDALYNPAGQAYRRDPTGRAGTEVGNEVDIILNFHLTTTSDILLAYCKLWGGDFLDNTAGPNRAADADVMYFLYQVKW